MGNIWPSEERFRQKLLGDLPDNPMIIFPQTIHFIENETIYQDKLCAQKYYNNKKSLVMVAREKNSYDIMKKMFPNVEVLLTPDIVLSANMNTFNVVQQERKGVLLCLRNDKEKVLSDTDCYSIQNYLENMQLSYTETDMHSDIKINKQNRYECVRSKMNEFAKSELVITDRLHAMIFSAITCTPCIVFSNFNHKVKGTYEWLKHLNYIKYVENIDEAKKYIPELLKLRDCKFDNKPFINEFEKLKEVIKKYVD